MPYAQLMMSMQEHGLGSLGEEAGSEAADSSEFEADFWEEDEDAGVAVRRKDGRCVCFLP